MKNQIIQTDEERGMSIMGRIGAYFQNLTNNPSENEVELLEIATKSLGDDLGQAESGYRGKITRTTSPDGTQVEEFEFEKMARVIREDLR